MLRWPARAHLERPARRNTAITKRYRVALLGTGRVGGLTEGEPHFSAFPRPYGHFSAYQAIEQTEVVAIANRAIRHIGIPLKAL